MNSKKFFPFKYVEYLQQACFAKDMIEECQVSELIQMAKELTVMPYFGQPVFYILDYTKNAYLFMGGNPKGSLGYDANEFIEGGIPLLLHLLHEDDFKVYNEIIFPQNLSILNNTCQTEHKDLSFSYNFRLKSKSGKLITVYQRGCYITDKKNSMPLYSAGSVIDVTHMLEKDYLVSHLVEKNSVTGVEKFNQILVKNHFYATEESNQLTRQEKIVLQYLSDGLSSKMIADKLNISQFTVNNHRQHILIKSQTQNTAQLVAYAVRNKWI